MRAVLRAMRADGIEAPQAAGLWYIKRLRIPKFMAKNHGYEPGDDRMMTALMRWTDATLHLGNGVSVMSDEPSELSRHLPVVLHAEGRVLVTGLGLGCVVRGLLTRSAVEHIDVIEICPYVIKMIGPSFEGEPRVTIHEGDALTYDWPSRARWDFAWHDLWCEDGSLDVLHAELLARYRSRVSRQGAWQFPRPVKRIWPDPLLNQTARARRAVAG